MQNIVQIAAHVCRTQHRKQRIFTIAPAARKSAAQKSVHAAAHFVATSRVYCLRPISLLRLSLLRLLDSNFLGNRTGLGIPPLNIKIMFGSNPGKPSNIHHVSTEIGCTAPVLGFSPIVADIRRKETCGRR